MSTVTIGVLGLQGAAREHHDAFARLGVATADVRRPTHLDDVDALVIPGGESTTISMLLDRSGLAGPLARRLGEGMPALGTCAGMIILAAEVLDGRTDQRAYGAIDLTVRRNAFGRQNDSFEAPLVVDGLAEPFHAVFIRAPWVERVGDGVETLASVERDGAAHPVLCRSGNVVVTAFHPELTTDPAIHRLWLETFPG